jgi:ring-1,2-phenylacetyl-CoA epoxidase subunit PaaC
MSAHVEYVLRLADTHLIWSHRLSEWCGHGPVLEEDIALANIGLDLLGQARLLFQHAAALEGKQRTEDDFAYWRDDRAYRNFTLAELPNGDYAFTIARNLALAAFCLAAWRSLARSNDATLAAIAQKAVKETQYHLTHARDWTIRFGDSTPEARQRIEAALTEVFRFVPELFRADTIDEDMHAQGIAPQPLSALQPIWNDLMEAVLTEATLKVPASSPFISKGKFGEHSEHLSPLLAQMQSVARAHPGAVW